jgi:glycosyltransferase involved in cell wall biosynthesis
MKERGVTSAIDVLPTGIYIDQFSQGDGKTIRDKLNIPADVFVAGYVGRLAPEKNLEFVTRAVDQFLKNEPKAHFLIGGTGPSEESIKEIMAKDGLTDRLHFAGMLKGKDLVDAYHAMDVFVFASQSETQGLVVTEAMAAGIPVVAVDAPGVREVLKDGVNGRLILRETVEDFVSALGWFKNQPESRTKEIRKACQETAQGFSMKDCAQRALKIYVSLTINSGFFRRQFEDGFWSNAIRSFQTQWGLAKNLTHATGAFISPILGTEQTMDATKVQKPPGSNVKN